ncbi:MAG: alpha/beta hydrolase, partial [Sphingomonas bacterium]|nr:alpha/beta hydrolase [Sphingomonas bacterium]
MTVWRHGYASSGDERIYWEAGGDGLTIVLCHGAGSNHVSFYNQMAGMASDEVRVVTWDQRGYGNSTCVGGAVGPRTATSDLTAVLAAAGATGPVHVVGQAMGAF